MPQQKTELSLTLEELKLLSPIIEKYTDRYLPSIDESKVISKINEFIIDNE
jgi:hypothetical protein